MKLKQIMVVLYSSEKEEVFTEFVQPVKIEMVSEPHFKTNLKNDVLIIAIDCKELEDEDE